ncbi:MAG: CDF family Co(II)/Ni(II) efflux transporter DmeF [Hyphomicrobiales bacterium]|nr:CDF family Co(II)/Ni(II) efflux transporter DmeF [Hyphomicrobiales bacterium]
MHSHSLAPWTHNHTFLGAHHGDHERRTWSVVALTAAMMVVEIVGGLMFGSLALVADGWHMGTHVAALAIAGLAYLFARRHAHDTRFSLGTGKFGELAAFASAIVLGMIALGVGYEAVLRLLHPVTIHFREVIPIALVGLCVNLVSAWLLRGSHDPGHGGNDHDHDHAANSRAAHAHDSNFQAAYVHVLADALTSILTIGGLSLGWMFGWTFMDPVVGLVGAIVILSWSVSLVRTAGGVLLDTVPDPMLAQRIRERIETGGDRLADFHLWRVGPGHTAVIASVVSDAPQAPSVYKWRLEDLAGLSHVTIEVNACPH